MPLDGTFCAPPPALPSLPPPTTRAHRPSTLHAQRLLWQLRTVSVRNLAASADGTPPPSTVVQVLARPPPASAAAQSPALHVYYTSEMAAVTHHPTWLVLDMEEAVPPGLPGEELCIRVFASSSCFQDDEGEGDASPAQAPRRGRIRRREQPAEGAKPLAEFSFQLSRLWCLPTNVKLAHLRLPAAPASCLLATGEGGTGLLVSHELCEALGFLSASNGDAGGNRPQDAHLLDATYLEELEEFHRHPDTATTEAMAKLQLGEASGTDHHNSNRNNSNNHANERLRADRAHVLGVLETQRLVLAEEEAALAREEAALEEETQVLQALTEWHQALDADAARTLAEIEAQEEALLQKGFLVAARQRKLLGELQAIYPIERRSGEQEYRIRGLELPADVVNSPRDEELIASALGYVSHLVLMLSKYLEVPLRYALECKSSRSLIRDATVGYAVFPLYRRGVERERFEWAVHLLRKDIQQLLCARGVRALLQQHDRGGSSGGGGGSSMHELNGAAMLQSLDALFTHELNSSSTSFSGVGSSFSM